MGVDVTVGKYVVIRYESSIILILIDLRPNDDVILVVPAFDPLPVFIAFAIVSLFVYELDPIVFINVVSRDTVNNDNNEIISAIGNIYDRLQKLISMPRKQRLATALRIAASKNDPDMVARITVELKTDSLVGTADSELRIVYKPYSKLRNFYDFG